MVSTLLKALIPVFWPKCSYCPTIYIPRAHIINGIYTTLIFIFRIYFKLHSPKFVRYWENFQRSLVVWILNCTDIYTITQTILRHGQMWLSFGKPNKNLERLNYRIPGHLFTSYWIIIVPIVFRFILQKILTHAKQVVQSGPAFCSCSRSKVGFIIRIKRQSWFHRWQSFE